LNDWIIGGLNHLKSGANYSMIPSRMIQFDDVSCWAWSIGMTAESAASITGESFAASRWTRGNRFFPTRIVVSSLHVSRVKPRLFGSSEESIAISQVASVEISTGIIWSQIRIDSTGGADPITSHGHRKRDAIRIRELIETYQVGRGSGPSTTTGQS
jgi:hypothetical protein